ncbi:MAG: Sensor protein, partial [uncultured bacterium]
MHIQAHEKGLDFTLEQPSNLPRHVTVDGGKLRQVLINLIGNAIKYTKRGSVIFRARVTGQDSTDRVRIRFEIEDTGIGIQKEDQERIFLPFVQLGEQIPAQAGTG